LNFDEKYPTIHLHFQLVQTSTCYCYSNLAPSKWRWIISIMLLIINFDGYDELLIWPFIWCHLYWPYDYFSLHNETAFIWPLSAESFTAWSIFTLLLRKVMVLHFTCPALLSFSQYIFFVLVCWIISSNIIDFQQA